MSAACRADTEPARAEFLAWPAARGSAGATDWKLGWKLGAASGVKGLCWGPATGAALKAGKLATGSLGPTALTWRGACVRTASVIRFGFLGCGFLVRGCSLTSREAGAATVGGSLRTVWVGAATAACEAEPLMRPMS